jgi:hypothetical protein
MEGSLGAAGELSGVEASAERGAIARGTAARKQLPLRSAPAATAIIVAVALLCMWLLAVGCDVSIHAVAKHGRSKAIVRPAAYN